MTPTRINARERENGLFVFISGFMPGARQARIVAAVLCAVGVLGMPPAAAQDQPLEPFFGIYEGKSISTNADGLTARDMKVSIAPTGRGFNVTWNTVTHKAEGRSKVKTYSIDFEPTGREGIFGSEMRRNMFGDRVPLDPLRGEPYVWARISGNVLTVYALHITDEGGYEMQVYHRTRTQQGMDVQFTRFREGEPVKVVTGTLDRVGP